MEHLAGSIESTATSKSQQLITEFETTIRTTMEWLTNVAEPFIRQNRDMGYTHAEATEFVRRYQNMAQEIGVSPQEFSR